jgi:tetratricopeptide (TPR) repeat protein
VIPKRRTFFRLLGVILASLASADCLTGADAQMNLSGKTWIEITGGSGPKAWAIRYGTSESYQKRFALGGSNRAWFSHGGWLRLVDTASGIVIGRWRFPGSIVHLVPGDSGIQVQVEDKEGERVFVRLTTFEPGGGGVIPYWPSGSLLLNRVPSTEVEAMWGTPAKVGILSESWQLSADLDTQKLRSQLEEAARRDPLTPSIRVALWRLLRETRDARAPTVLEAALRIETTDFTETLRLASLLESLEAPEPARRFFESGYRDFLDKGNDPRLMMGLIGKLILYPPQTLRMADLTGDRGRESMERQYRLAPHCEAADLAWTTYAEALERTGRPEDARVWRLRGEEATSTSVFLMPRRWTLVADAVLLIMIAALASAALYVILLWMRFRPQRRADSAALAPRSRVVRLLAHASFQHWNRNQRLAFLSIVLIAWFGAGIEAGIMRGILRTAAAPLGMAMGSLAGPVPVWHLENHLPPSPERDLLLAVAHQQSGQAAQAERLYRALPGFAESWNNLGVILQSRGLEQEARQAFEKALQLDPKLDEAALNLGRAPRRLWAGQYGQYFPGRPMLAPPIPERLPRAFLGGSLGRVFLRGWAGPFADSNPWRTGIFISGAGSGDTPAATLLTVFFVAALALAVALLFIPRGAVSQQPSRAFAILEALFPGVSPVWGPLGGLVLVTWTYLLFQGVLILKIGTPFILTSIAMPNLARPFGLPPGDPSSLLSMLNPSWMWVYLAPALLFVVNLGLVLVSQRETESHSALSVD